MVQALRSAITGPSRATTRLRLADCTRGRDYNFNLLRIVAALAVLVGHSFGLTGLPAPGSAYLDLTPGRVAVDLFSVTSGLLVTASLLRRRDTEEFVAARFLRVFPGLWVVLGLSVFALGPFFTDLPLARYFNDPQTLVYLGKNATLFSGVAYTLPGVFAHHRIDAAVNGSLWTLPDEVRAYAILALAGFSCSGNALDFPAALPSPSSR